ncbi:putative FK506-binding protein 2 precursor [Monocercomonoides exilis]|uniref:putative FK506-binding protein 2 precursor n=1 Tax=Monocercomonoides exilis TaxID=2049356 RepID=UPI00355A6D8A|nr:putative FK506-binding protein 2 precursor [Monocercomonoides exilis]|eukprot:MONOS_9808.1-p1 / transcript=MONOS_9808.1 / gene=MONOS_9808 / organism=Monocercomonoides_exilis_PA203 / gene_product=FK506-binding protein 2 precursor / transcript_product=FK506-binding protein 2 precursor / location=Mono_scaffold00419:10215-11103(+) / protein_length=197 / sequence_SO=supercontig / SO=protein_coding / is_pseudo=false
MLVSFSVLFLILSSFADEEPKKEENGGESETPKVKIITLMKPDDCSEKTRKGCKVSVHYVGTVSETGEEFDNSWSRKEPFSFRLGEGHVIKGWEEGLLDMCVGEKRKLIVPAELAYGEAGIPDQIPPNAELTYIIDLMDMKNKPKKGLSPLQRLEEKAHAKVRHDTKATFVGDLQPDGSRLIKELKYDASKHGAIEL